MINLNIRCSKFYAFNLLDNEEATYKQLINNLKDKLNLGSKSSHYDA